MRTYFWKLVLALALSKYNEVKAEYGFKIILFRGKKNNLFITISKAPRRGTELYSF